MGLIFTDTRPTKKLVAELIEEVDEDDKRSVEGALGLITPLAEPLGVKSEKLVPLLRSQILSGNKRAAIRVVAGLRDRRLAPLPRCILGLLLAPLGFAILLVCLPFILLKKILEMV